MWLAAAFLLTTVYCYAAEVCWPLNTRHDMKMEEWAEKWMQREREKEEPAAWWGEQGMRGNNSCIVASFTYLSRVPLKWYLANWLPTLYERRVERALICGSSPVSTLDTHTQGICACVGFLRVCVEQTGINATWAAAESVSWTFFVRPRKEKTGKGKSCHIPRRLFHRRRNFVYFWDSPPFWSPSGALIVSYCVCLCVRACVSVCVCGLWLFGLTLVRQTARAIVNRPDSGGSRTRPRSVGGLIAFISQSRCWVHCFVFYFSERAIWTYFLPLDCQQSAWGRSSRARHHWRHLVPSTLPCFCWLHFLFSGFASSSTHQLSNRDWM